MRSRWILPTGCQLALALWAVAHGDLHEQIETVTRQIRRSPREAQLHLKRGELHRAHGDWKKALADYDRAAGLDPGMEIVLLARGQALLESGQFRPAKDELDRFLKKQPNHADGHLIRARALAKLNEHPAAAEDYTLAINLSEEPRPEFFLERAEVLVRDGRPEAALQGIQAGIDKLGSIVTLQLSAIDMELNLRRFEAALARLDGLTAQSQRKESWLARRGEILLQAGRTNEARAACTSALTELESLPSRLRKTEAMRELEARVRRTLARMAGEPVARSDPESPVPFPK